MKGCSKCPWCYPVPFKNWASAGGVINCQYYCSLYSEWCSEKGDCGHPGGKGLKGPKYPLCHYAKKGQQKKAGV